MVRNVMVMTGMTRLELAASALTGQRSNQLSYTPTYHHRRNKAEFTQDAGTMSRAKFSFLPSSAHVINYACSFVNTCQSA